VNGGYSSVGLIHEYQLAARPHLRGADSLGYRAQIPDRVEPGVICARIESSRHRDLDR
jgi:hypothetical protein